jgi:acyl carrier protein
MSGTLTLAQALSMLEEAFMATPGSLREDTAREEVGGWDSMGALMLMSELDSRFGLLLEPESFRAMRRVSDVLALLKSRGFLES